MRISSCFFAAPPPKNKLNLHPFVDSMKKIMKGGLSKKWGSVQVCPAKD
jgi:hypothetical protein